MEEGDRKDLCKAKATLKRRLDPGSNMLAAQDFRRASQRKDESIADYIRRLERVFRQAYGSDGMSAETRAALLYGQMQEGLKLELMESPAVSGAANYKQLCLAARNEEKRLKELEKRRRFLRSSTTVPSNTTSDSGQNREPAPNMRRGPNRIPDDIRCFTCGQPSHLARDCSNPRTEGGVNERRWSRGDTQRNKQPMAKQYHNPAFG